ncbi:hypothetical protein E2C01_005911 [Portunus trituberculatus]|uniref:Uncharacterized protein n=1 Tax=Portunus trituberculatus TaxID=210409 RepID=A0A5B7CUN3_PORTR|nr:hypothetical protein [Portunus trituberculatus]
MWYNDVPFVYIPQVAVRPQVRMIYTSYFSHVSIGFPIDKQDLLASTRLLEVHDDPSDGNGAGAPQIMEKESIAGKATRSLRRPNMVETFFHLNKDMSH